MPHDLKDLIRELLNKDHSERLGSESFLQEFIN